MNFHRLCSQTSLPAILLSLAATWLGAELILRTFTPTALQDQDYFFGFRGTPAYFVQSQDRPVYVTSPLVELASDTFAVTKPAGTLRIFVLGGSTTYGEPWGPPGAFAFWLEDRLNFFAQGERYEVINCGHKGFGSFRVRVIFDEIMRYAPDAVILYTGVNELRDLAFHHTEIAIAARPVLQTLKTIADHSYVFRLGFAVLGKKRVTSYGAQAVHRILSHAPADLRAYEDKYAYAAKIHRILQWHAESAATESVALENKPPWQDMLEPWHPQVRRNFEYNLNAMAAACRQRGVPLLFMTRARNLYGKAEFMAAFEERDSVNEVITQVAGTHGFPLVSSLVAVQAHFGMAAGFNAFADEVHPTLECNQVLAQALCDTLAARGIIPLTIASMAARTPAYAQHARERAAQVPLNSDVLALQGWQKLIEQFPQLHDAQVRAEVLTLANCALAMNPRQVEACFLLGTLARAQGDTALARTIWTRLAQEFPSLR